MKNIAIITARSGSKGLKNKNIKLLNGKPLLAYSIEQAIDSGCFDVVFVSTDSKEYAAISKKHGAEVPFLRSEETSSDKASSWDVVKEVLCNYNKLGKTFDSFMLLQPTSPLRTKTDIKNAFKLMEEKKANSVVSVCEVDHNPNSFLKLNASLNMSAVLKKRDNNIRRQDAEKYYRFNGAIYLAKTEYFLKYKNVYDSKCYAYIMDKKKSIDIDDEIDFKLAEVLMKRKKDN